MRSSSRASVARAALSVTLLALPPVLAFFTGGYEDEPRLWAAAVAWAIVIGALVLRPRPLPRRPESWITLGCLAGLAVFSLASIGWAPVADTALAAGQRLVLYTGLVAGAGLLLGGTARRVVEPALAGGILLVVGYGLSERWLPGLLHFHHSLSAQGRLEQPLTYWNALGEEAALGLVLVARLAGDGARPASLRLAAVAAAAPLGLGLYLTFSRGALFAAAAGLLALWFAAPSRRTLRTICLCILAAAIAAACAAPFGGVTSLSGTLRTREWQGALVLGLVVIVAAAAAAAAWWLERRADESLDRPIRLPRHATLLALALVCGGLAVAIVSGSHESAGGRLSGGVARFGTLQSDRYDYWRVALRAFGTEPIRGVGAENWGTYWLRWRPYGVGAQDAHSLPLQTLAELGLIGFVLLLGLIAGLTLAARRAHRIDAARAAGPIALLVAYLAHAPLDWDWQMPALTAVALIAGGALIAIVEAGPAAAPTPDAGPAPGPASLLVVRRPRRAALGGALAVSILALAWTAVSLRQVRLTNDVISLLDRHPRLTAAQADRARRTLDAADFLNPTWNVRSQRITLASHAGRTEQALLLARAGVRYEPRNVQTWLVLALAEVGHPAAYADAERHIGQLVPPVPAPR